MISNKVKEVIVDTLGCELEEVLDTSDLMEDLGADSLDAVELSMALEDEFGITISDEEFKDLKTVLDIIEYIKKKS